MGIHRIIDEANYGKQIQKAGSKLVVIMFFASWCGHCKMIAPVIKELSDELKNKVIFLDVDIDENADIAKHEYIVGTPTFVLYKERERINVTSKESKLREMITQYK